MILGLVPAIRERRGAQTWGTDGRPSFASPTSEPIEASIQPVRGSTLRMLPEGEREEATHEAYTRSELLVSDVVIYNSRRYRVMAVAPWAVLLAHYHAVLSMETGQ